MHADKIAQTSRASEQAIAPCSKQELPTAARSGTIMAKKAADA